MTDADADRWLAGYEAGREAERAEWEEEVARLRNLLEVTEHSYTVAKEGQFEFEDEINRLRAALAWCARHGGWRLFEFADAPPPEGIFDLSDRFNPKLKGDDASPPA